MALSVIPWLNQKRRAAARMIRESRFARERRSSTSVEFAVVGLVYFTILFFVVEGGIFYIKVTLLDVATENAARTILLNGNPNTTVTAAPTTAADFATLVVKDAFGVLRAGNIQVALQIAPPRSGNPIGSGGHYGFLTIPPFDFTSGAAPPYQYTNPGVCPVNYETTLADNGSNSSSLLGIAPTNGTITACTPNSCLSNGITSANGDNGEPVIIGGIADDGSTSKTTTTTADGTHQLFNTIYSNGTYTCYAGEDVLLQVRYTNPALDIVVGPYFSSVTSTVAFQIEPPPQ